MKPMAVISLWQPWASLCVLGAKEFETRSWRAEYQGPLLIHAAKHWTREEKKLCSDEPFRSVMERVGLFPFGPMPLGVIVGRVELVSVWRTEDTYPVISETERAFGNYDAGRFAWKLLNPVAFREPVPCKGLQGFFNLPLELRAAVKMQLQGGGKA